MIVVALPHLDRHEVLEFLRLAVADADERCDGLVLEDELAGQHAAGRRLDPVVPPRGQVAAVPPADHGVRPRFPVRDDPHAGALRHVDAQTRRLVRDALELEPPFVGLAEKEQGEGRRVDGAEDVADVVPRALRQDPPHPVVQRRPGVEKELGQPLVAVAHPAAVGFEDVPEAEVPVRSLRLDEEVVRSQSDPYDRVVPDPAERAGHGSTLMIPFLHHDARELRVEVFDVVGRADEHQPQ